MAVFKNKEKESKKDFQLSDAEKVTSKSKKIKVRKKKIKKNEKVKPKKKRFAIFREITWPSFPSAVLQAVACAAATAGVGTLIYLFDYGVNQLIALIV